MNELMIIGFCFGAVIGFALGLFWKDLTRKPDDEND